MTPLITALLGKGFNLVANAVMAKGKGWVEDKLGVELKPDMTSEDYAKLQIAQMQHEEELLKLKLEESKLDLQELDLRLKDTDSARKRESEIATSEKAPLLNKIVTPVLALGVTAITFVLFGFLMFDSSPVEPSRKDVLVYVLGALTAISTQVISYYFGSSVGSKDKSAQLDKVLK